MKKVKFAIFTMFLFFISLGSVSANSCTYVNGNLKITCNYDVNRINYNTVGCLFSESNVEYGKMYVGLTKSDYKNKSDSESYQCSQVPTIYVDMVSAANNQKWKIFKITKNNTGCSKSLEYFNKNISNYSGVKAPNGCTKFSFNDKSGTVGGSNPITGIDSDKNNGGNSGNTGSTVKKKPSNNSNAGAEVIEHFCEGNVLNVFKAVGWIFFIIKIVVPILLIVFGCIDFAKAIISSKDDEIKKSIKTLAIRSIAGIIIFFVPYVINLIVQVIGGEDVYRGSEFGACTECILDPGSSSCK